MPFSPTSLELPVGRIIFADQPSAILNGEAPALRLALPLLAGSPSDILFQGNPGTRESFHLYQNEHYVAGLAVGRSDESLEGATGRLYRELLGATEGLSLYRIWNYVPHINDADQGLEAYRRFSRARSLAFEATFGPDFSRHLPAASAVGANQGALALAFIAGPASPRRFENPKQVPAYAYPAEHGPRPPSFCRALAVQVGADETIFISGTAAIRGHTSMAQANLSTQIEYTVENLRAVAREAGAGEDLGGTGDWRRRFTVYLRHPSDLAQAKALLAPLFRAEDHVSFVQSDVCRRELLIEIECTLRRSR